ncbi:helix-turn-helix transcriptional regulator [Lederbergia sp. NSJ-179]|uniref:helix-turn-helix domain-containing protein n=1 Tax=Lederbergia sp. NSJ-179 TaxID=2931402 RepID=UPI001FD60375|nr:response regulator transcription factor [Lederbergia sp. NSJ-179]MCJ7843188.1 helix-turn-helix transcriptional regulator [Lederbergia sp. NSJ-179]
MKKSRMFYQLFIPFFLLGISLVVGFSIYIYNSTYKSVEQNFLDGKKNYIKQVHDNVEQKVRTIEYGYTAYSSTSNFGETLKKALTEKDYDIYRDVKKEMNYIEMMGIEGSQYDLISLSGKWGIMNGSLIKLTDKEIDEYKHTYIDNQNKNLFWKPIEGKKDGIEMVVTLPMYQKEKFALGMASIPRRSIDQIVSDQDNLVQIYNSQDQLIYSSKKQKNKLGINGYQQLKAMAHKNDQIPLFFTTEDKKHYVFIKSDYNKWLYLVEINGNEISSLIHNTRFGLFISSILLILLVAIISYYLAESFLRPLKKIQEKLSIGEIGYKRKNELFLLEDSIDQIVGQNERLTAHLTLQKPQLETLFVLSLFRNRMNESEVTYRLQQLGYHFDEDKVFYTGLIQIDNLKEQQIADKNLFLLAINNIVEEMVSDRKRLMPIVLNNATQATIFILNRKDQEAERHLMKTYEEIQKKIEEVLQITISVGISPQYTSLMDSEKSMDLAIESLHYRVNVGYGAIIFYDDIAPMLNATSIAKFPVDIQNKLMKAIRSGEEETATQLAANLVDTTFRLNKNPISLGVTLLRIINELVQLGQLLAVEPKIFENIKKLYQEATNAYDPEQIKQLLIYDLIKPVISSAQDKTEQGFKAIAENIALIVQTEYDQEISLDIIADRLHYSPNYLSNIFKKEFGENFVDYLMNYRLQMAKNLLRDTDVPIKGIAERLKYRNSQNFIRFFKKKLGKTPGEYRKEFRYK